MHVTHPVFGELTLSDEQAHIVNEIGSALLSETVEGRRKMIRARAGSGKTTVACVAAYVHRDLYQNGIYAAFGRTLGDETNPKLAGTPMSAINFHKLGYRAFAQIAPRVQNKKGRDTDRVKITVNKAKQYFQARDYVDRHYTAAAGYGSRRNNDLGQKIELTSLLAELIDKARLNLINPTDTQAVRKLCDHYGIKQNEWLIDRLPDYMILNMSAAMEGGTIDYTDMVYVPYRHAEDIDWPIADLLFLDECQDMSALTLEFMLKHTNERTAIIGLGDPQQSIMGFAGAMSNSFHLVAERIGVQMEDYLPMSLSRRSAKRIIELAQEDVPDIQALPDAPEGRVDYLPEANVLLQAGDGDFILSRTTAPLVELWLEMIVAGLPVAIRGQEDDAKNLQKLLEKIVKQPRFNFDDFAYYVDVYANWMLDSMRENGASLSKITTFEDQIGIIRTLANCERFTSLQDIYQAIKNMFEEKPGDTILMTAHRSKGLEATTVFLLKPEKFPLIRPNTQEWEIEQEYNLRYVARTRARRRLVFLTHKDFDVEPTKDVDTLNVRDWLAIEALRNGHAKTPELLPAPPTNGHQREAVPTLAAPEASAPAAQTSPQVQQLTLLLEEMSEQDRAMLRALLNRS